MGWWNATWIVGGMAVLAAGCAAAPVATQSADPVPVPVAERLPVTVAVRQGGFDRSHLDPDGVVLRFTRALDDAGVFERVVEFPGSGPPTPWELELAGADFGEPGAYTLELEALLLHRRTLVQTYRTRRSVRSRRRDGAVAVDAAQLATLAHAALGDLVEQIAADRERLRTELTVRTAHAQRTGRSLPATGDADPRSTT